MGSCLCANSVKSPSCWVVPTTCGILATGPTDGAKYNYEPAPIGVRERVQRLEDLCRQHEVDLPAVALQFPLAHPVISTIIPGGRTVEQYAESYDYLAASIPAAFWTDLRNSGLVRRGRASTGDNMTQPPERNLLVTLYALGHIEPQVHPDATVADDAVVIGNVQIGANTVIGNRAVLRGDDALIAIGDGTVIGPRSVIPCDPRPPDNDRGLGHHRCSRTHRKFPHHDWRRHRRRRHRLGRRGRGARCSGGPKIDRGRRRCHRSWTARCWHTR